MGLTWGCRVRVRLGVRVRVRLGVRVRVRVPDEALAPDNEAEELHVQVDVEHDRLAALDGHIGAEAGQGAAADLSALAVPGEGLRPQGAAAAFG